MDPQNDPTPIMQEYLAETYRIAVYQDDPYVSTSLLADRLKKTAPAVVRMASRLHDSGYIEHKPYQGIRLTPKGEREALANIRQHRIVEVFLVNVMGFGWDEVHEEADAMASHISDRVLERMEIMLEYPTRCPHGEPIPTPEGVMPQVKDYPLTEVDPPRDLIISRVNTHDADKLVYLRELKLLPGEEVTLLSRAPFNGPLRLKMGPHEQVIGAELAGALRVCEPGEF